MVASGGTADPTVIASGGTEVVSAHGTDLGAQTVGDGRHAASIALLGNYMAASFVTTADGHGGTLISEAQAQSQPLLTNPRHG